MTNKEIKEIIEKHQHWLKEDCEGWENMKANLRGADLRKADLRGADLRGADLRKANLRGAKNISSVLSNACTAFFAIGCPEKGAFTAFKKCGSYIVELDVCADAKRSSATSV